MILFDEIKGTKLEKYYKEDLLRLIGYDKDDCTYDSIESFLQISMLNFCGCGNPELSIKYVYNKLYELKQRRDDHDFGNIIYNEEYYFCYYVFDMLNLTEHGGSVPGWLTDKGNDFLDICEIYFNSDEFSDD